MSVNRSDRYDLIVVGSGFAGCMTALNFLETSQNARKHVRVALVEAGKNGERCGASRWTGAFLRLDRDLNFDPGWIREMTDVSDGQADLEYCKKLAKEARATAEYLQDHGVRFIRHAEENVLLEFETDQHFVMPEGGGWAMVQVLMEHLHRFDNCEVHWQTEARKLLRDPRGRVNGVTVRRSNGLLEDLYAPDVMLSCGGFEGNQEMLARHVGPTTDQLSLIAPGLRYNRGQGLKMALDVGCDTAGSFDGMHLELADARTSKPNAAIYGHSYGIVVDEQCERFYDEGKRQLFATFEGIAVELWRGHHNNKGFFITDATIMERFRPGWVYESTDREPFQADTIRELAMTLGVDPVQLHRTISEFNAACNDKPFDPMQLDGKATSGLRINKSNWATPLDNPPYYAFPVTAQLVFTFGGIKVNTDSQVLAPDGAPIPGLWATGELTGLYYNGNPPLTSVLRCLTFGRLAGTLLAQKTASH
ncbi:succinate dehydrogenase/fumarate reductase flavo protein subunit [Aspergillus heteromorphus CBS 117.55]|uniref:Succinate dehydrogenase/fumarate reductase flavo protein subunit n=1 Tax=Aspergillus heteromorphus CBS 117.55 TaxID=1448321 RepID=A0A317W9U1_9EURO|nr:succinate dehydrogenase/fumarate reductase flavo protein subunit [Aspergillus heteromorphus CBS 117.55]PWY83354.1 succinate dehydrogenase/fumarate reductase flavo protein subunit [Aspergillus heteromorphus CBS 117.55]